MPTLSYQSPIFYRQSPAFPHQSPIFYKIERKTATRIKGKKIKCQKLDSVIRKSVPSGFAIRTKAHRFADEFDFHTLKCSEHIILDELVKGMKWKVLDSCECIHNYVDNSDDTIHAFGAPMLRKGAISAKSGEKVIIPINMRDGIILGTGLGNIDWNRSAPHGSGRIMKREDVKNRLRLFFMSFV